MSVNEKERLIRKIPDILHMINDTADEKKITLYENIMLCIFVSPFMFVGSVLNFILRYLVFQEDLNSVVLNSIMLLVMGVAFELTHRIKMDLILQTYLIIFLFSALNLFVATRIYYINGHAYWTIVAIQIIMAMSRIKRILLISVGITTFFSAIYIYTSYPSITFETGPQYYITQTVLVIFLFLISYAVYQITYRRYQITNGKYKESNRQKEEITALYEQLAATEEELRHNNKQLHVYNQLIKKNEEGLKHLAYFDSLTELPNRKMFIERLNFLKESNKNSNPLYVVFIDLDNFKRINDTMGHLIGDLLLQEVAGCLKRNVCQGDIVGRIGGDEFALIISRKVNKTEVYDYIELLRKSLLKPFSLRNHQLRTSASFGIAVFPHDGEEIIDLLKSADTSMYKAKELGKNNIQFFEESMLQEVLEKSKMESKLISAVQNEEFYLVFQPQVSLNQNMIKGFEALIRWESPKLGCVSPLKFIPIAEETSLILPIGEWVLRTACEKFKILLDKYNIKATISINISAVQIKDKNFLDIIKKILIDTNLDPESIQLEITESVFIDSIDYAVKLLKELKGMGLKIALDDFGTGFSSLSYLKILPIDSLKIDRSFVKDLSWDTSNKHIVGDIISLAHNLELNVIAEGVESEQQLSYLKKVSCDAVQGFLFGQPLKEDELDSFIQVHSNMMLLQKSNNK